MKFFQAENPWCKMESSRFGIPKLVTALSTLLSSMIRERYINNRTSLTESLPEVQKAISTSRKEVEDKIAALPESFAAEPQTKLLGLCTEFIDEIKSYAVGATSHGALFREMTAIFRQFRNRLHRTVPTFDISSEDKDGEEKPDQIIDLSDCEDNLEAKCISHSGSGENL